MAECLQRLSEQHGVETVGLKITQTLVQILFNDIDSTLYAALYLIGVDLEPNAAHVFGLSNVLEQRAVAAAKIEHATVLRDPTLNDFLIRTHRG